MFALLFNPDTWAAVPYHFWSLVFFVFGCMWGSFLNVCIHRMPIGLSVVSPGSHCPQCRYAIPWYLNIPLVTWLWLRGRCANCRAPISVRYFLVELLTGLLFLGCWLQFGARTDPLPSIPLGLIYCVFVAGLIVATFIDFEHFIIPDEITIGGMVVGFLASLALPALHGGNATRPEALLQSGVGLAVGGGLIFALLNGGKLLFGKKQLDLPAGSTVTFHDTELELPGDRVPLERVEGFRRDEGALVITFDRAFVGDDVLTLGSVRVGLFGVQARAAEASLDLAGEVSFRLLHAPPPVVPEAEVPAFARLRRVFSRPQLQLESGAPYLLSPAGVRPGAVRIPFEEMFYRKSDTLRLSAQQALVYERASEPYPELFENVTVALSQERLIVGDRTFAPTDVPYMQVITDSLVVPREAMGFGDVKFMAAIGAFLGWQATIFALMVSAMIGSVVGGGLVLLGRRAWSSKIPYGPYIALAALLWLFGGRGWMEWWFSTGGGLVPR